MTTSTGSAREKERVLADLQASADRAGRLKTELARLTASAIKRSVFEARICRLTGELASEVARQNRLLDELARGRDQQPRSGLVDDLVFCGMAERNTER